MKEYRICEVRAEQPTVEGEKLILKGTAIVYDEPT